MMTLWNRRELTVTTDLKRQGEIRSILSLHKIPYIIKTKNIAGGDVFGSRRGQVGSFGIRTEASYEYIFYVHKTDYEQAKQLI